MDPGPETLIYAVYEWLDSTSYLPDELFEVVVRDIAILLIGFESSLNMPGLADALVSPPSRRSMKGGVTDEELLALRQAAEAEGASQNARNRYRNGQLRYNTERQVLAIREERPEVLAIKGAAPLPREPRLPDDLDQFFRRIEELRTAKIAIARAAAEARQRLDTLDELVNVANITRRYRTANEANQGRLVNDRLERINTALARVRQELGQLSQPNLPRLIRSAAFSAAGTALTFGGLTAATGVVTGVALLGATGVGLAAAAAAAATVAVADNPATVQRAVNGVYGVLSGVLSSFHDTMAASQHLEDYGELPDFNTPLVQAASRLARPYGATINITGEPTGYNEHGTPIYNYMRQGQPGVPYYDPSALATDEVDAHPISMLLAYPVRIAATVVFVGGTNLLYQAFTHREEASLRGEESALQRNTNSSIAEINRLIDIARERHNEAKARALAEFERQRARVDEQERIITEAYAEFVRQRATRVEAYQALMDRWYEGRQAAVIAERAANAQVDFANAVMAMARGGPAMIEAPRGAAPLLVLNQAVAPAAPAAPVAPANAPANARANAPANAGLNAAAPAPRGEELNAEGGRRRRRTRGRRPARKSRKLLRRR